MLHPITKYFYLLQLQNLYEFHAIKGETAPLDKDFEVAQLEVSGDLAVIPDPAGTKHKLYAINLDLTSAPFLLFKSPFQQLAWKGQNGPRKGWQVMLTDEFLQQHPQLSKDVQELPFLQVEKAIPLEIERESIPGFVDMFEKMQSAQKEGQEAVITENAHALLLAIKRLFNKYSRLQPELQLQVKQADKSLFVRFKEMLEHLNFKYPREEFRQLDFFAERLDVNAHVLNTAVKRINGSSAVQMIHERSLNEAKELLRTTHLTIKEIAYRMAFQDPAKFSAFFKKHTGITPAQFREHQRRWQ